MILALRIALRPACAARVEDTFARAWAEGQAMTLEEAVEYALGNDEGDKDEGEA